MKNLDRRSFLRSAGSVVVGTAAGPILLDVMSRGGLSAAQAAEHMRAPLPVGTPICVQITLDGGNDCLNTLVPVNDPWYYDTSYGHGALALPAGSCLPLTNLPDYRLHPNLTWLANRWNSRFDVAFVLGIGELTKADFSHFNSMKYWQTADLSLLEPTGWMGRYNDAVHPGNPLSTVSLYDLRLEAVGSTSPTLVLYDTANFSYSLPWYDTEAARVALEKMATHVGGGFHEQAAKLISSTFDVSAQVTAAHDAAIDDGDYAYITEQLLQVAMLIRAGIPCQTYATAFGTFDHHSGLLDNQAACFTDLNEALTKFFAALAGHPREQDVFVVITSEFGRQVTANENQGVDHGQGGMAIVIGTRATGGIFGEPPTLDPGGEDRPNRIWDALKPTTDFRRLWATVIDHLAGTSGVSDEVLRGRYPEFGFFKDPVACGRLASSEGSVDVRAAWRSLLPLAAPVAAGALLKRFRERAIQPSATRSVERAGDPPEHVDCDCHSPHDSAPSA